MCDSLTADSMAMTDSVAMPMPHHMGAADENSCCEDLGVSNNTSCEMHSCVYVGLQSSEFKHAVSFGFSRYNTAPQTTHILVTIENLYRPPISLIS